MHPHTLIVVTGLALIGLLAATPSDARPGLLSEGSRPPTFALPDGTGKTVSLRTFLGSRRIVVLFGPSTSYLKTVHAQRTQFEERDLTVLAVVPQDDSQINAVHAGPVHVVRDTDGSVGREFGAGSDRPVFYLIGKDGHIALARHGYPASQELFGVIDAMPMRRQEMRDRHR